MTINLFESTESSLKGAIGELIAWRYLHVHRIWSYSLHTVLGAGHVLGIELENQKPDWINEAQAAYLVKGGFPRTWDFVGVRKRDKLKKKWKTKEGWRFKYETVVEAIYLFEIKSGWKKNIGSDGRGKIPPRDEIELVKSLGFVPALIKVQFTEGWTADVTTLLL
jgi:hypothetical protein